jgi:hypothetical protein
MADLLEFNNLFWNVQSAEEDTTLFTSSPKAITELSILGQGTIAVRSKATQALTFVVSPKNKYPSLSLKITQTNYNFAKEDESQKETSLDKDVKHVRLEANPYLPQTATADGTVYWLSIDRSNWILRYGKYYGCNALTILQVSLDEKSGAWLKELANVNVTDEVSVNYRFRFIRWNPNRLVKVYTAFANYFGTATDDNDFSTPGYNRSPTARRHERIGHTA